MTVIAFRYPHLRRRLALAALRVCRACDPFAVHPCQDCKSNREIARATR